MIKNFFTKLSLSKKLSWIILAFILLFTFVSIWYCDIETTYRHSLILIDSFLNGKVFHFYNFFSVSLYGPAVYLIPLYAIFAIWNIPSFLITRNFAFDDNSIYCLLWAKLLLAFFLIASLFFIIQIFKKIKYKEQEYLIFLFLSSLLLYCPLFIIGQYDIIGITFMLWGMYYYLKDEKLSPRTIFIFSIAISLKGFAFFMYLILVLLEEKRILHIFLKVLYGFLFSIITILFFMPEYMISTSQFHDSMLRKLFAVAIPAGNYSISIFGSAFALICIFAYLYNSYDVNSKFKIWSWLGGVFWLVFFIFICKPPLYWIIWIIPFFIFIIGENSNLKKINTLFITITEILLIIIYSSDYFLFYICAGSPYCPIYKYIINFSEAAKIGLINYPLLQYSLPLINSFGLVFGFIFLIINNPWKKLINQDTIILSENTIRLARCGLLVMYFMAAIFANKYF